jgi:hypothetical protein
VSSGRSLWPQNKLANERASNEGSTGTPDKAGSAARRCLMVRAPVGHRIIVSTAS